MTSAPATLPPERSLVERLLRPVADVRAGEGAVVLLMALNLFLVLSAYYMLKTVREALILTEASAADKTALAAVQAVLLIFLVPAFGAFASRVNRLKLLTWVTVFFVTNIVVFFLFGRTGAHLGVVFFIWVGIFNVMAISQFWAFANDIYTPEQGKRLLAVIGIGSSLGAWAGSAVASFFGKMLGPYALMLLAAVVLLLCVGVTRIVSALQARSDAPEKRAEAEQPLGKEGGFQLIRKDRYLMLIAALIVVLNVVNTTGEYLLGEKAQQEARARFGNEEASRPDRQKFMAGFFGDFFGWVNLAGFLAQTLVVSRVMTVLGVGGALFVHPLIALIGYSTMIWAPSLALVRGLKIADNATDYSLNNTVKQALWLPTSREAKYKAKQAVDSFFWRTGDVISAIIVKTGAALAFSVPVFAAINVGFALVWLFIVSKLGSENKRRMAAANAE
ncbi:MAG TPA: Npt1/Npt2 family nucleotide transporter [Vicinamibacteria bacterium]|nr:Npt1/Npt2 family nucleotide transporter [Vicinamibacteria bacterium]